MLDKLLQISLVELENGYMFDAEHERYICLSCGKEFESGEIFPVDGKFYDALKAVRLHIEKDHGGVIEILSSYDKKSTGMTENQKELLLMMSQGLTDKEIAQKTGTAPATVRHQRFIFREKAKQAKLYLAIFETVESAAIKKKGKSSTDEFISVHNGATMVDERYTVTKEEEDKILTSVFSSLKPLKLKIFSSKEKKKIVTLRKIAEKFEKGRKYSEKELNTILKDIYDDFATIRRYLIEYGFMDRTKDCREYWLM